MVNNQRQVASVFVHVVNDIFLPVTNLNAQIYLKRQFFLIIRQIGFVNTSILYKLHRSENLVLV